MHETAPTQFVQVGDAEVAYRRFGKRGAPPLLVLNYFAANMDDWDPKITNGFAAARDIIILDYPGIGLSSDTTPSTVAAMTLDLIAFCRALSLNSFDIVGFSLGGMIAQQLAFEFPDMVRRRITADIHLLEVIVPTRRDDLPLKFALKLDVRHSIDAKEIIRSTTIGFGRVHAISNDIDTGGFQTLDRFDYFLREIGSLGFQAFGPGGTVVIELDKDLLHDATLLDAKRKDSRVRNRRKS